MVTSWTLQELERHKELSTEAAMTCLQSSLLKLDLALELHGMKCESVTVIRNALLTWGALHAGTKQADNRDTDAAIKALFDAVFAHYPSEETFPDLFETMREMALILQHKLVPHLVDEDALKGSDLRMTVGLCPVCGHPVSNIMSEDTCYFCGSLLTWTYTKW